MLGRVSLHASHSCLQMKIFPSLKKVRKNLTFLFFAFLFLKLRYSCFTMLCWFLLYNKWISHMYTYIPSLEPPSPPDPCYLMAECQAGLPVLYSSFPLAVVYIYWWWYVNPTVSIRPSPPTHVHMSVLYVCVRAQSCPTLLRPHGR